MRIGWIADYPPYIGGAELTQRQFQKTRPSDIQIVQAQPLEIPTDVDGYVVHNCVEFDERLIGPLSSKPVIKFHHDMWPSGSPDLRNFILSYAKHLFCSQPHYEWFKREWPGMKDDHALCPPDCDLSAWEKAGKQFPLDRRWGNCWFGRLHPLKGIKQAEEWAEKNNEPLTFFGSGRLKPQISDLIKYQGEIPYNRLPEQLAQFKRFVFFPVDREPFGRSVVEANALGLEIVTNSRVGATWWLEERPESLRHASDIFWTQVRSHVEG